MWSIRWSMQRWKFRRRGDGRRQNKANSPLFFFLYLHVSKLFPFSGTSSSLSMSEASLLSLVMRNRDNLLNCMGKLRHGWSISLGFDTVNEDKRFKKTVFWNNYVTSHKFWSQNSLFMTFRYFSIGWIFFQR